MDKIVDCFLSTKFDKIVVCELKNGFFRVVIIVENEEIVNKSV